MPMCLKKGSVPTLCSADELAWLIKTMEEDLPFESKGRVCGAADLKQKRRGRGLDLYTIRRPPLVMLSHRFAT